MLTSLENHKVCPVETSLKVIGNKWTMLIIRDLLVGTKRFGELQRSLVGISPRTLSQRLQELEAQKIIKKKIFSEIPPKTEYSLTEKGQALMPILGQMIDWSEKFILVDLES